MDFDCIVIGAGLAGLTASRKLQSLGKSVLTIEAKTQVGGRVRSDRIDGYICDRGFQVINPKYPQVAKTGLLKKLDFKEIKFIGLDLKSDVVISNQQIAKRLQLEGLEFLNINADDYRSNMPIDLVIALHACDCATDIAIKLATKWQTKILFLAPCCHQYLNKQIKCEEFQSLLKYGIFKERFSALLTDALRVSHLEDRGYNCDVIEFVDREDSLKNVLIKAIYSENKNRAKNTKSENLKNLFHIKPWLDIEG